MGKPAAAVFLDRDGTINVDTGYVSRPEEVVLIAGADEALAGLKAAGYLIVVVSNQSAIGRGMASAEDVDRTNDEIVRQLRLKYPQSGVDYFLCCPHHPDDRCSCRKPETGLVEAAQPAFSYQVEGSWMVGDRRSDIGFARNLGIARERRILVRTGKGEAELAEIEAADEAKDFIVCADIGEAAKRILSSRTAV